MNKDEWRERIRESCTQAGTYQPCFDDVIETLAGILSKRDTVEENWDGEVVVEHTNRNGNTNKEQSPSVRLINDLNRDALSYWKELGLTPASLKKINETAMKEKKKESALERALKSLA